MKELRKIAELISRRGIKNIPLLNLKRDLEQPGLENQLFYNIQDGQYKDDQEASMNIYNADAADHRYKMLKSRVRQKILNHLFFLDQEDPNLENELVLREDCLRILYLGNLLVLEKDFEIAEKLLNRCYNLAIEAEYTEIVINSLELLKIIYTENSRPLLLQKNIDEIENKRKLLVIEKQAENLYLKNLVILKKTYNARQKYMDEVVKDLNEIEKIYKTTSSSNVYNFHYDLFIKYHLIHGDYQKVIEFVGLYENAFETKKLNNRRFEPVANRYYLLYALFKNGDYDKAHEQAEELIKNQDNDRFWLKINEVYFLTLMHLGHFTKALQVVRSVFTSKYFNQLREEEIKRWSVYSGYLIIAGIENINIKGLLIDQVLETIPDRNGSDHQMNLSVLILHLGLVVKEGKIDAVKELIREISYYIYKHPVAAYSPRSRMFLKLVNVILKCDMEARICKKKGRYLYQQLKHTDQYGDAYSDLEILPYDVIWEKLMESIEQETVDVG
jgi:cytochrome b involved in lipid metabolism